MQRRYRPLKWGRVLGAIVLLALVQTTVMGLFNFGGVYPVLLLPLVVTFASRTNLRAACGLSCLAGVAQDLLSGTPFGTYALLLTLVGIFCARAAQRSFIDHPLPMALLSFVAAMAVNIGCVVILRGRLQGLDGVFAKSLTAGILVVAASIAMNPAVKRTSHWFGLTGAMVF